jgi:hypothetical protein
MKKLNNLEADECNAPFLAWKDHDIPDMRIKRETWYLDVNYQTKETKWEFYLHGKCFFHLFEAKGDILQAWIDVEDPYYQPYMNLTLEGELEFIDEWKPFKKRFILRAFLENLCRGDET